MKEFLITAALAIAYFIGGAIVIFILSWVFTYMVKWHWLLIILFGFGGIAFFAGFGQMVAIAVLPLSRNVIGRILTVLISICLLAFILCSIWIVGFGGDNNAKGVVVNIISSIVYSFVFIPGVITGIIGYKS